MMQDFRNQFRIYLQTQQASPNTVRNYLTHIERFTFTFPEGELSKHSFYDWWVKTYSDLDERGQEKRSSTKCVAYAAFKAYFRFLQIEDLLQIDPMIKVPRPKAPGKKPRSIDSVTLRRIERNLSKAPEDVQIMFLLLRHGPFRVGEVLSLDLGSIQIDAEGVHFVWEGKGNKQYETTFWAGSEAHKRLLKFLRGKSEGILFPLKYHQFHYLWNQHISSKVTCHQLRNTLISEMINSGVPIEVVQEYFNHSDIATTRRYADVNKQRKNKLAKEFQLSSK